MLQEHLCIIESSKLKQYCDYYRQNSNHYFWTKVAKKQPEWGVQYISASLFVEIKIWVIGEKISRQFDFLDVYFKRIHHGLLRVFVSCLIFFDREQMNVAVLVFILFMHCGWPAETCHAGWKNCLHWVLTWNIGKKIEVDRRRSWVVQGHWWEFRHQMKVGSPQP